MKISVVQQYDSQFEILPSITIGILLNVVGRFLCAKAAGHVGFADNIFLDMIGTLYAAVMVGPWWGAMVGIAGNAIDGIFFDNYFPFGVVNVCGGLAWGYLAIDANLRAKMAERRPTLRRLAGSFLVLWIVGVIVCVSASLLVKLVLYPEMGRPFVWGALYQHLAGLLPAAASQFHSGVGTMIIGDLYRESVDKAIVVAVGLLLVCLSRSVAIHVETSSRWESLRVDAPALLGFSLMYGAYILAARINKPRIAFAGARWPVDWLQHPNIIALFYFPIVLALVVFLIASYDSDRAYGRMVDSHRLARRNRYRRISPAMTWSFVHSEVRLGFSQGKEVYTLVAGIAVWPFAKLTEITGVSAAYVFGVGFAAAYYLYNNSRLVDRYDLVGKNLSLLNRWMDIRETANTPYIPVRLLQIFQTGLGAAAGPLRRSRAFSYQLMSVSRTGNSSTPRKLHESDDKLMLTCVMTGDRTIDKYVRDEIDVILASAHPETTFILCANFADACNSEWIRSWMKKRHQIALLSWADLAKCIEKPSATDWQGAVSDWQIRTLDLVAGRPPLDEALPTDVHTEDSARALAARSLPSLAFVLDRLPAHSVVFDTGCGRGRHSLYGLLAGHSIVANDRNATALSELRSYAESLPNLATNLTLVEGDYLTIDPKKYEQPQLVIATGVLQHAVSVEDLRTRLSFLLNLANDPNASLYVEMLFDMKFDGRPASDDRLEITRDGFEKVLTELCPAELWLVERVAGPIHRVQNFSSGPRSFYPIGRSVEFDAVEYLVTSATSMSIRKETKVVK